MCREIEKLVEKKSEIRYAEGRADTVLQFMRNTGKNYDEVVELMGYSEKEAKKLQPFVEWAQKNPRATN